MECKSDTIKFSFECFIFNLEHDVKFAVMFTFFCLIISYTVVVNLIVLVSILLDKLNNRLDICFISNAFSDLLIGVFVLPVLTIYCLFGYIPLNEYYCSVWVTLDFSISTTSMLHFTYISYDRYLSVLKPVKYSSNNRHTITYIILFMLYLVSALCWIPLVFYHVSHGVKSANVFSLNLISNQTNLTELNACSFALEPFVIIPHALVVYLLPMLFIFSFYSKTIKMLNSKIRRRSSYSVSKISFSTTNNNTNTNQKSNEEISEERFSSIKKITRDFFKLKKKTSNEPSTLVNVPTINLISNHDYKDDQTSSDQNDEEDEEEDNKEEKSNIPINKTVIIDSDPTRVKIFIKCKHFSDITLNNVNNNNNQSMTNMTSSQHHSDEQSLKPKRSAISLNEMELFKIKTISSLNKTDYSTRAKSLSEFRFNSNHLDDDKRLGLNEDVNNSKKDLLKHIKQMGKKTIKFASAQSIRKKLSISFEPSVRRVSEFGLQIRRKSLTQREKNITYKLGFIMVLVLVSWVPFAILWPISSICLKCIPNYVYLFSIWLTYVNSLLSPLILITSNSKYSLLINLIKNVFYKN